MQKRTVLGIIGVTAVILLGGIYLTSRQDVHGPLPAIKQDVVQNLVSPSETFSSPRWNMEGISVESDAAMALNGTKTATRLTVTAVPGWHRIETSTTGLTPNAMHTLSIFIKPGEQMSLLLEMRDVRPGKQGIARFDLGGKSVYSISGDVVDAGVLPVGNGWQRVWATMSYTMDHAVFNIALTSPEQVPVYMGDGKSDVLIWGVQLEQSTRPRPYTANMTKPAAGEP